MSARRRQHVFVSYSSRNAVAVSRIVSRLKNWGYRIWLDEYDIEPGSHWRASIVESLERAKVVLLIVSKAAVASRMVDWELDTATAADVKVIPVILEQVRLPKRLSNKLGQFQQVSLTPGRERGLAKLVDALGGVRGLVAKLPGDRKYPELRRNALLIAELLRLMQEIADGGTATFTGGRDWAYYIQFLTSPDNPHVDSEAVSNRNLKGEYRLTKQQEATIRTLGWKGPAATSGGNFQRQWHCISDRDRALVAGEIMHTFLKVYDHLPGERLRVEIHLF